MAAPMSRTSFAVGEDSRRQNPAMVANSPHSNPSLSFSDAGSKKSQAQPLSPHQNLEVSLPFQIENSPGKRVTNCTLHPSWAFLLSLKYQSFFSLSNIWDKIP